MERGRERAGRERIREKADQLGSVQTQYSGTSLNGPSKMWTTSVQQTAQMAPFDFSMRLVHF